MHVDERELVRRCVQGDPHAWRVFVARYDPVIRRHVRQIYRSADVDDVTSAVYEYLISNNYKILSSFRWQCSLDKWMRIIARTCALRAMRKARLQEELVETPGGEDPGDLVLRQEQVEEARAIFEQLPARDRVVLAMFLYDGMDYREIGRALNMPVGSVGSIISRARQKLAAALRHVRA